MTEKEDLGSFAVGHIAVAYVLGKGSAAVVRTKPIVPILIMLSVLPDIDILGERFIMHRGPTHSVIVITAALVPFFLVYRKRAIPYFLALLQHPLIADYASGGRLQLFWPLSTRFYGLEISITSPFSMTLEWGFFVASIIVMAKASDLSKFFKPYVFNLILILPTFTVLLPALVGFPTSVPIVLLPTHVIYAATFLVAIAVALKKLH